MTKIIISDVHGCYLTLQYLLKKCPEGEVILAGDLIDRGPRSAQVIDWALGNKIRCIMGNHEDLMLFWYHCPTASFYDDRKQWEYNGAWKTLESYPKTDGKQNVSKVHQRWVSELPLFIEINEPGAQPLIISHTGYGDDSDLDLQSKLWLRYGMESGPFPDDGKFRVFGHTQKQYPWIEKNLAMIDTGCAYKDRDMGKLTAFLWPQKQIIQQECID